MSKKSNSYNFMLEDYFLILLGHLSLHRFVLCLFIDCNYHSEGYEKMLMECGCGNNKLHKGRC